jgi:hypothetical protein
MSIIAKRLSAKKLKASSQVGAPGDNVVKSIKYNSTTKGPDDTGLATLDSFAHVIKVNTNQITVPADGIVDLGRCIKVVEINGQDLQPNDAGEIVIGDVATKDINKSTFSLTWAQVKSGVLSSLFQDICKYPVSDAIRPVLNIGGDTTFPANTDYVLDFDGIFSGTNFQVYDLSTAQAFKRKVVFGSPNMCSLTIRTLRCQCLAISTWINTKYVYIAATTFDSPTSANYFYNFADCPGVYIYIANGTFPSAVGSASGLFTVNVGTTVAYAGPIPSFYSTPVPGTKYIRVQLGAKLYIKNAWAIDASNIDTDGTGTVVVAGKQILPTF